MLQTDQEIVSMQQKLAALERRASIGATSQATPTQPTATAPDNLTGSLNMQVVRMGELADVVYRKDPNTATITRTNGQPGVVVMIDPAQNANTVQVVNAVKQTLASTVPASGYQWQALTDASTMDRQSVDGMMREALLGALFATIVTLLFLRDLSATLVAQCSIQAAIGATCAMGYSVNILTLSGIAVAVGRMVDDSIVVIENIYRQLSAQGTKRFKFY